MTSRRRLKLTKTSFDRRGRADVMRGVKSLDQGAAVLVAGSAIEGSSEEDRLENPEGEGRERPRR